jgi:hypothetical protein
MHLSRELRFFVSLYGQETRHGNETPLCSPVRFLSFRPANHLRWPRRASGITITAAPA